MVTKFFLNSRYEKKILGCIKELDIKDAYKINITFTSNKTQIKLHYQTQKEHTKMNKINEKAILKMQAKENHKEKTNMAKMEWEKAWDIK